MLRVAAARGVLVDLDHNFLAMGIDASPFSGYT